VDFVSNEQQTTLYLRGVPSHLVREAKSAAARRGITLRELVQESLEQSLLANSERAAPPAPLADDQAWFEIEHERLSTLYPNQYIAIIQRSVVDHDIEFEPLARRVFGRFGVKSILMPQCGPASQEVKIRSPRVKAL
jgi:hypothetical protein